MGFYPVAIYYNKTQHTNNKPHTQTNTAHKTTQIKDTLHTMNANTITTTTNTITIKYINKK
jgi:hypothetical protein